MKEFGRAFAAQLRVLRALILRYMVIEGGRRSLPFIDPVIRPASMIMTFYVLGRGVGIVMPGGFPLLLFLITSFLCWDDFQRCFTQVMVEGQAPLLIFPQVTPLDLMLSRISEAFLTRTTMFIMFCMIGTLFERTPPPANPLGVLMGYWCALTFALTLGMIGGCIGRYTRVLDDLWNGVRALGHIASGIFFLGTQVPTPILNVMRWNPLFQSVEWLRESWLPTYHSPVADPGYIFMVLFFMLAAGLAFERASRIQVTA